MNKGFKVDRRGDGAWSRKITLKGDFYEITVCIGLVSVFN